MGLIFSNLSPMVTEYMDFIHRMEEASFATLELGISPMNLSISVSTLSSDIRNKIISLYSVFYKRKRFEIIKHNHSDLHFL
jgi:hypothetical protein